MKRLTVESIQSQKPREVVVYLMQSNMVSNPYALSEALRGWIIRHVTLLDEFEEMLISPSALIDEIARDGRTQGDCDEIAMLSAAVLASAGALVQLIACFPQPDTSYGHVFTRYKFPRQDAWVDFDPSIGYNQPVYPADVLTVDIIS
jgi:transglutaminase-like putative cysteine protease